MERTRHIEDYLKYLHDHPGITAIKQFKCGASHGKPPAFYSTAPAGNCFLYPEFLIFLTTSKSDTGWKSFLDNALDFMSADLAFMRWVNDPINLLKDVVKSINAYMKPKEMEEALSNPNSIFIPFHIITSVDAARDWSQGNHILVHTNEGDIAILEHISDCPNAISDLLHGRKPTFVTPKYIFNKLKGHILGEWQTDVVAALQSAAKN